MANILKFVTIMARNAIRHREMISALSDTPTLPTAPELDKVYEVYTTAKSLDDLPLFTRDKPCA